MDGEEVLGAFGCQTGYGQRIKVYNAIKSAVNTTPLQEEVT